LDLGIDAAHADDAFEPFTEAEVELPAWVVKVPKPPKGALLSTNWRSKARFSRMLVKVGDRKLRKPLCTSVPAKPGGVS
jgi:hypothetical protein